MIKLVTPSSTKPSTACPALQSAPVLNAPLTNLAPFSALRLVPFIVLFSAVNLGNLVPAFLAAISNIVPGRLTGNAAFILCRLCLTAIAPLMPDLKLLDEAAAVLVAPITADRALRPIEKAVLAPAVATIIAACPTASPEVKVL